MKQLKILIVRFLLFFYLSSSYLSATHIHYDALESHSDCKVCIVVKNINSGDVPNIEIEHLDLLYGYESIGYKLEKTNNIILKGFNANAPPLS